MAHASVAVQWRLLLFVGLLLHVPTIAQVNIDGERRAMLNGDVRGVIHRLEHAVAHLPPSTTPFEHARLLEALGEQYHRLSEIGEAKHRWDDALRIRQRAFGDSSAEAAVGYAYRARYHNYMAASQTDHQPLAWQEAQRALRLDQGNRKNLSVSEQVLIQREAGYAWKVMGRRLTDDLHKTLERTRRFYREALRLAQTGRDTLSMAQLIHDIGNTYTDETDHYSTQWPRERIRVLVDSARSYYALSIDLLHACGMDRSEAMMMEHFTTALVLYYGYRLDSLALLTDAYDRALRTMLVQVGHPPEVAPYTYDPRIANKAQMVELLTLRAGQLANYREAEGPRYLPEALATLEAAVPYWEAMLQEYRSTDFHKVVGSYNHFPFQLGTCLLTDLYRTTGDQRYLHQALSWFDRNRNALEQRDAMRANRLLVNASVPGSNTDRHTPAGEACVAIHDHYHQTTFTLLPDRVEARIFDGPQVAHYAPWQLVEELHNALRSDQPQRYRRAAYRLYQATIAQALADPSITTLTIIPSEVFERLPFEALVTDTLGAATWGSLHYVQDRCAVRYARTIQEALAPPVPVDMDALVALIAQAPGTSEIPFANALVHQLDGTALTNRDDLLRFLHGSGPVHLASHAVAPRTPDEASYIQLPDGPFRLDQLERTRSQAPFVVLSTCSSGEGRFFSGVGTMSLGNAFLRSGTNAVVQTLWPVDDQATSEVLAIMYEAMQAGTTAADALAQAKRTFVQRHRTDPLSNPYYWSGIVLSGRAIASRNPHRYTLLATTGIGLALLALGGSYWLRKRTRSSRAFAANTGSAEAATSSNS